MQSQRNEPVRIWQKQNLQRVLSQILTAFGFALQSGF